MKSSDKYIKKILKNTEYSGNLQPKAREISASQLGSDPQEALLRYKHGVVKRSDINQATIGSLVHLALEYIYSSDKDYSCELHVEQQLDNGFLLTGTIDRVDNVDNVIVDTKVTKTYTIKKILEDPMHPYRLQINAYRMMLENETKQEYSMMLEIFNKEGGYNVRFDETIPDITYLEIDRIANEIIIEEVNKLVDFVKNGVEQKCKDVWFRKVQGQTIPLKCLKYCSYNNVCKFYNPKPNTTVKGWL